MPRSYPISPGWRVFLIACGGVFCAAGAAFAWHFAGRPLLAVGSFLFSPVGAAMIVGALRSRLILTADAIEVVELGRTRRLRRDEIAGLRVEPAGHNMSQLVMIPRSPGRKKLKIPLLFARDPIFDAWIASIPDLDAADRRRTGEELLAAAGGDQGRVARARKVARVLNGITFALLGLGWFYPQPYRVVVVALAALPVLALVTVGRWPGLFRLNGSRNDTQPDLTLTLILPGAVLMLRALFDIQILDWHPMVVRVSLGALVFVAAIYAVDANTRKKPWMILAWLLFAVMYSYGALLVANGLLDRSPGVVREATVAAKHVSSGKQTNYHLRLDGLAPDGTDALVSRAFYERVEPGATVSVTIRRGALGVPWFVIHQK